MPAVVGSIAAELLLDTGPFNQGLGRAGITAKKFEGDTRQTLGRVDRNFSSTFGNIAKGAGSAAMALGKAGLAGAVAAIGGGALFGTIRDTARALADIGDKARQAGIDVRAFQELGAVARANRLEIDDLSAAMRELALRGDEWIASAGKSGSAAEAFARIGYTVDELKEKLKDPSALLSEIIGKVEGLDRAAQIRIFDELFGGDGERMIRLLDDGEAGIQRIIQAAKDSGQIFDEQMISKANDLDRAFNDVATTVSTNLQQAIVNASWALFDFLQQFKAMEDRTTTSLESRLEGLGRDIVAKDRERLQALSDSRSDPGKASLYQGFALELEQEIAALRAEEASILKVLQSRSQPITPPAASTPPTVPSSGGSGGGRSSAITETEKQAQATDALLTKLREELALVGANATEQRIVNELKAAGVSINSQAGQEIASLVQSIEAETLAYQTLQDAVATASDLTRDFVGGLVTDLRNGVSGAEALSNAFGRLGDRLLDMALDQAINGLFAKLLGAGAGSFGANSQVLEIAA